MTRRHGPGHIDVIGRIAIVVAATIGAIVAAAFLTACQDRAVVTASAEPEDTAPAARTAVTALASIDAGEPRPFAFNEATVWSRDGIAGVARLTGIDSGGGRIPLYEATTGYADELTLAYYAWPGLVAIEFEGFSGTGAALSGTFRLRRGGPDADDDTDAMTLAARSFPYRQLPTRTPRRSIATAGLTAGDPETAARTALAQLFVPGRRAAPLAALIVWTAAAIAFAASARKTATIKTAALACAVCAMTALSFALGSAPAELYAVAIAPEPAAASVALTRRVAGSGAYRELFWSGTAEAGSGPGTLWFIGLRSPRAASVPVAALSRYRRIRFKTAPLVVAGRDGRPMLAAAPFIMAWGIHE